MPGLVTVSDKRTRLYDRQFDHEEAQALHQQGWTYRQLADRYDVTYAAVRRVCDPDVRAAMDATAAAHNRAKRQPCLGDCGALVWTHMRGRSGLCPACFGAARTAPDERAGELRCTKCDTWQPDDQFGREHRTTRRGHRSWCRTCETKARAANRAANRERENKHDREYKRKGKSVADYVVLRRDSDDRWLEVDQVEASSRMHAIEKIADAEGDYVAVTLAQITPFKVEQRMAFKVTANGSGTETPSA